MRKFWGFYENGIFRVGCNGATVYIYDCNGKELARFKDFPYAYQAAFLPGKNIIAVKSTMGYLGFYDLDHLALIKKYTITTIGGQDEGFAFSADGKFFYNIEKPMATTDTQLGIYDMSDFSKVHTLFSDDKRMTLNSLEIDKDSGKCYVCGFMRRTDGVYDYGFTAVFDRDALCITEIQTLPDEQYKYLSEYKAWEICGFTEKAIEWNLTLKQFETLTPISIKEVHEQKEHISSK